MPPGFGRFIGWHGVVAVRRGESDRDAVRLMRQAARDGRAVAVFVEGTRQRSGVPGVAQPGRAMVAIQEDVPVVPVAIYGTQFWRRWNFAPCSIAVGEPVRFEGLPKGGRGYKEATAEIERRIRVLFDWLADVHARGPAARARRRRCERCRADPGRAQSTWQQNQRRRADRKGLTARPIGTARSRSSASRTSASRR